MPGEEVLLDLNVLAGDSDYFALGAYDLAPAQDLLLYSTDHDGSERYTMRIRDLRTGDDLADVIPDTTYGTAWAGDTTVLLRAPRRRRCARTRCGATRSARATGDDVLVFEEADERFFVSASASASPRRGSTSAPARRSPARSS